MKPPKEVGAAVVAVLAPNNPMLGCAWEVAEGKAKELPKPPVPPLVELAGNKLPGWPAVEVVSENGVDVLPKALG